MDKNETNGVIASIAKGMIEGAIVYTIGTIFINGICVTIENLK